MKNTYNILYAILAVTMIVSVGCGKINKYENKSTSKITDIDGNEYKTVKIGMQQWTVENLNVEHYRNGDVIPQVQDVDKWLKLTTGAWCFYIEPSNSNTMYGKLYNWYAVNDPRGLAPEGWHIPTDEEWAILIDNLGGEKEAGNKMKSTLGWIANGNGANSSGFTAFPGGVRGLEGNFGFINKYTSFWSTLEENNINAWGRFLGYEGSLVSRGNYPKNDGLSVRCVKD